MGISSLKRQIIAYRIEKFAFLFRENSKKDFIFLRRSAIINIISPKGGVRVKIEKGVNIVCGHYGSGKTNFAVNLAIEAKAAYPEAEVYIADLDIVNPYFRTADAAELLKEHGIIPVLPQYANSNVDIPALPPQMTRLIESKDAVAIIDVGGDDGAVALGMYREAIKRAGYEMYFVVNMYRPLIEEATDAADCMREIECASGLGCTQLVNNSSLGEETTADDVIRSVGYAHACAEACSLPLAAHSYREDLDPCLIEKMAEAGYEDEPLFGMANATKKLF